MPEGPVDPARLEGEALRRWYMRSPDEIEQERQADQARRNKAFFGADAAASGRVAQPVEQPIRAMGTSDDDVLWIPNSGGGYRAIRSGAQPYFPDDQPKAAYPPANPAAPESGELTEIGSRENQALKKQYIAKNGSWLRTEDGRDYEVSHRRAIADGGQNTLENIEPIHPDDHRPMHVRQGDSGRWAKRSWIARAFGGRVVPPKPAPMKLRGFGPLGFLSDITGIASGRIRTDTPVHFWYDMAGFPAPDDYGPKPGEVV